MSDQPPGDRAVLLAYSIRTLRGFWIETRCCRTTFLSLRIMASNRGLADRTLADVLVLLRCQRRHRRPGSAALVGDAGGGAHGRLSPPGWRVVLVGDDGP